VKRGSAPVRLMRMRRLAALIGMAVLLAACGSTDAPESADAQEAAPSTTARDAGSAMSEAASEPSDGPFDAVPAVGGGQVDGGKLAGRDLALWFWAPW